MNLAVIGLMIVATLATWLFRHHRLTVLMLMSVISLYALQPVGSLDLALPTGTLLLTLGVWWLTNPTPTTGDGRTLLLIACAAAILPVLLGGPSNLRALPPLAVVAVGVVATGALVPERDDAARRRLAVGFVALVIILLLILKVPVLQTIVTDSIAKLTDQAMVPGWQWLGFSYIAFRLMHVLLDFRNQRLGRSSLRDFVLYVVFYPTLPAGPIDRIGHFTRELQNPVMCDSDLVLAGITRIGVGLFKKFVLADTLAYIALKPRLIAEMTGSPYTFALTWIMLYAFTLQLYFDFAGYTDIAVGMGRLAGITLPENFSAPYTRRNITAFWNNWHITLSTWFHNYFFTPFSRALMQTPLRAHRLLIILIVQVSTMVLIGLWHGVALNFVLWGLWHGIGLWLHKWLTDHTRGWDAYVQSRPPLARVIHVLSIVTTFHFVAIGWIFFALPNLSLVRQVLAGLVGLHG